MPKLYDPLLEEPAGAVFDRHFAVASIETERQFIRRLAAIRKRGVSPDLAALIDDLLPSARALLHRAALLATWGL